MSLHIGCKGISCAQCGEVLLEKPKDRPLPVTIGDIIAAVIGHLPDCPNPEENVHG